MTTYDPFSLSNVKLSHKAEIHCADYEKEIDTKELREVVWKIAIDKPGWKLVSHSERVYDSNKKVSIHTFNVFMDGEMLGRIGRTYIRGYNGIEISNDRIAQERQRGNSYRTTTPAHAVAKIKKMFGRKTAAERFGVAAVGAHAIFRNELNGKNSELSSCDYYIEKRAVRYVAEVAHPQFADHLRDTNDTGTLTKLERRRELCMEINTVKEVRQALENNGAALVIRDGGTYLVKVLDNVQVYTDTTLPAKLASKIGMLKLVDNEAIVSGVGCRVNAEMFVVMVDDVPLDGNGEQK